MKVSNSWLIIVFILASLVDLTTTLYGIEKGFSEANPVVASRLANLSSFVLSYLAYTLLGATVLWLSLRMSSFSRAFKAFALLFVFLKALPAINNVLLLAGVLRLSPIFTVVREVLRFI